MFNYYYLYYASWNTTHDPTWPNSDNWKPSSTCLEHSAWSYGMLGHSFYTEHRAGHHEPTSHRTVTCTTWLNYSKNCRWNPREMSLCCCPLLTRTSFNNLILQLSFYSLRTQNNSLCSYTWSRSRKLGSMLVLFLDSGEVLKTSPRLEFVHQYDTFLVRCPLNTW